MPFEQLLFIFRRQRAIAGHPLVIIVGDEVENILDTQNVPNPDTLESAVRAYRDEQAEQREWGYRNDMAGAEEQFAAAVRAYLGKNAALSRAGQRPMTADAVKAADAMLSQKRGQFSPLDSTLRALSNAAGLTKLTRKGYDLLMRLGGLVPEKVKAGFISDYGIPQAVVDRRDTMFGHIRQNLRESQYQLERLMTLTRAESRIAYEWMNGREDIDLFNQLPDDSKSAIKELRDWITTMGAEAVRLGQLTADAYDRHKGAYLHRSYMKYESDQGKQAKANRARAIRVLGDQYKGRGMVDAVSMDRIKNAVGTEFWQRMLKPGEADKGLKGQMFIRLERRANRGQAVGVLAGIEDTGQRGNGPHVADARST